ncbi:MAG: hypothetical protein ACREOC_07405 [Gemmatimonadales bacterium]
MDAEKLAALMDGRLGERERAELLARLAASPDTLEVYADTAAVVGELESESAKVLPLSPRSREANRFLPRRWLAVAAILAGVAVVGPLLQLVLRSPSRVDAGRFIAPLVEDGTPLLAGWDERPWTTVRGGDAPEPLTPAARAARAGALSVDLEIAVWSRDTMAARLATELALLLGGLPAGAPVGTMYRVVAQRAGAPPEELQPLLERARVAASKLTEPDAFQLAAWAEAARIAAARRNAEFFRTRESRSVLDWASGLATLPEAARPVVERLRSELSVGGVPDWRALDHALTELLRVMGS